MYWNQWGPRLELVQKPGRDWGEAVTACASNLLNNCTWRHCAYSINRNCGDTFTQAFPIDGVSRVRLNADVRNNLAYKALITVINIVLVALHCVYVRWCTSMCRCMRSALLCSGVAGLIVHVVPLFAACDGWVCVQPGILICGSCCSWNLNEHSSSLWVLLHGAEISSSKGLCT